MPTLDSQVHAYERNHPGRPWASVLHGPAEVTGDQMVTAMDAVAVDGAVLVSPFSMYRYDASYAIAVHAAHPTRFRLVKPVDTSDPGVSDTIADWASTNGAVDSDGVHRGHHLVAGDLRWAMEHARPRASRVVAFIGVNLGIQSRHDSPP